MITIYWKNEQIYLRVSKNYKQTSFFTGYRCAEKEFKKGGKITNQEINRNVQQLKGKLQKAILDLQYEKGKDFTTKDVRDRFVGQSPKEAIKQTMPFKIVQFLREKPHFQAGTIKTYKTLKNHITKFNQDLTLDDIDLRFYDKFQKYLWEQELNNNSVVKIMQKLKAVCNHFYKRGEITGTAFKMFKDRETGKEPVFLNADELMRFTAIESFPEIRDLFLFSCYTGMRFSDVKNFHKSQITGNFIRITQIKTKDSALIPLNQYSKALLEKYDYSFPKLAEPYVNRMLKVIAKEAGIVDVLEKVTFRGAERLTRRAKKWELLTFHCGRSTFVMLHLLAGVAAEIIMRMTGHRDYSSFKRYVGYTPDILQRASDRVFD